MQATTTLRTTTTLPSTEISTAKLSARHLPVAQHWSASRWSLAFAALTAAIFVVHGYHPLAEDGGLYVAGVEFTLNPSLFPHFTEFVSEHLSFSIFAPLAAALTRATHLPLLVVLLIINFISITLALTGARAVLRRVTLNERAQLAGVATLATVWSVPIAGTSLMLMDPYVTARSLSTPLSLWAVAFALDKWRNNPRSAIGCTFALVLAAIFHPLMAGYALGLILVLRALRSYRKGSRLAILAILTFAAAAILQFRAPAESTAVVLAAKSRYYWFVSQWHWYEVFGLIGPILVLLALRRRNHFGLGTNGTMLCDSAILYGCFATALTLVFGHEHFHAHTVARLQPLRSFLTIYLIMFLLLGASTQRFLERASLWPGRYYARYAIIPILLASALGMFVAQRNEFPNSAHIELPWRLQQNPNPWVRAFLWSRDNTPQNALFALDAHYITAPGDDAHTFRAIAQRSALADFSKDGGEAAITPRLADEWVAGFSAQLSLDQQTASQLREHLGRYGVNWVILRSNSPAALSCPYENNLLKVCKLEP